jgi:hypothetical protein
MFWGKKMNNNDIIKISLVVLAVSLSITCLCAAYYFVEKAIKPQSIEISLLTDDLISRQVATAIIDTHLVDDMEEIKNATN